MARTICACAQCVACCTVQPGSCNPGDVERIADYLGEPVETAKLHFWASPGAVLMDSRSGRLLRVGTITPRLEGGRCVFLDDTDRCRVHAVAPAGCALFDVHMSRATSDPIMWAHLRAIMGAPEYAALRATLEPATSWQGRSTDGGV
jgi:Fe-S-cluster containining protein